MRAVDLRKSYQFNEAKTKTNIFSSLKYAEMFNSLKLVSNFVECCQNKYEMSDY